ncbi:MAG: 4Fe-4S dicluster domain-containing protein [Dehalococcoidia bacterium]
MRYGMVIDLKRCIGCYGCQISCKMENATPPGILYARVSKEEIGEFPNVRRASIPMLCMHCASPPCQEVCPSGATSQRPDGIVEIDDKKCVGCRYCMMACPYGARYYHAKVRSYFPGQGLTPYEEWGYRNHPTGVVEKCDFCQDRLAAGQEPACAASCPSHARFFGDLEDPFSEVAMLVRDRGGYQLHSQLGTDPSVYYLPS